MGDLGQRRFLGRISGICASASNTNYDRNAQMSVDKVYLQAVREGEEMKRPVNMTVEVDDANPQGYALRYADGSLSDRYFYRVEELDYSIQKAQVEQAWELMLKKQFRERYAVHYDSCSQLHRDGYEKIKKEIEPLKMVPVWLFTTHTND